jgi:hypothetical protein
MEENMNKISFDEFEKLYTTKFTEDAWHDFKSLMAAESYDSWIKYQEYSEFISEEEKAKYKYVVWDDFPTAESWIDHQMEERERKIAREEDMRKYMALPWYEKILMENGTCPIKNKIICAFFDDEKGEKIRSELCVWDLPSENLFDAIKHFARYVHGKTFTDEYIEGFINENKSQLDAWGVGICGDGGRALRTLRIACELFYKKVMP